MFFHYRERMRYERDRNARHRTHLSNRSLTVAALMQKLHLPLEDLPDFVGLSLTNN